MSVDRECFLNRKGDTITVNLPSNEFQGTFSPYALKPKFAVAKGGGGGGEGEEMMTMSTAKGELRQLT